MTSQLEYRKGDRYAPIPPSEAGLQTVEAEYFAQVSKERMHIEGICFDRTGDTMFFVSVQGCAVYRLDMNTKEVTKIHQCEGVFAAGAKMHKDGRLFVALVGHETSGGILAMNPDGSNVETIIWGYHVDDLQFDKNGGIYFNDFCGSNDNPIGGVYYLTPDFKTVRPIVKNLASPNGLALSTDESIMWVTEHTAHRLLRVPLAPGHYPTVAYRFFGYGGVDSCEIDEDDNLYVSMFDQARYLVFNSQGYPIANILMPHRDEGHNFCTSHATVRPGYREVYMTGCDDYSYDCMDRESEGAWIFKAGSFAKGFTGGFMFQ